MSMVDLSKFNGKTVMVTGATGLIGKAIIKRFLEWNKLTNNPIKILALARNKEKAETIFGKLDLEYIVSDILDISIENRNIDYIIHGASNTSSSDFVNMPVETIMINLLGTRRMLELARVNNVKGFVYLSSMEVYGQPSTDDKITETYTSNIDLLKVRSCYPESKRMCENLCSSYFFEYGIPIKVIRLTQTFGPGVEYNDSRVFAEFARCVIEEKDIILNTTGETKRSYLYIDDAVNAIIVVLTKGNNAEAYNAANEHTYCSIYEMASMVARKFGKNTKVIVDVKKNTSKFGYAPKLCMNLDTKKLQELGWYASVNLEEMFGYMIESMKRHF